jgi:2-dehydropantoate 2-reductase
MNAAIYGAGSLGTILGAYLAKNGHPIDLINHNKAHVEALNAHGAHIVGKVDFTVPVRALLPREMSEPYDVVFLMTKQLDNKAVVESLLPFLKPDGTLCTMQNGLPEPGIAEIVGKNRVIGCAIAWGATMLRPGVCELTSEPDTLTFSLGKLQGKPDQKLLEVKNLLELMGPVTVEENFIGARWAKLLVNAAFSGMSTVLGCTFGEVSSDKRARLCAQRIIKECIDVAHTTGIAIEPIQGKDIVKLFDYHSELKRLISFVLIPLAMKKHRMLKPSMLQDLEKGRHCEIDAINGVVSLFGGKLHVPTPYNDLVVEIVHEIESGKGSPSFRNLDRFLTLS